ncbi:MAG: hypothetical protein QMD09_06780, partial [Desulfatibacillaceae bacterium]|nr:hypothetical protein [Desulfatibacillaceae bacterium]
MLKTVFKPWQEIQSALANANSIGIVSCGICAQLSGTGGAQGAAAMSSLARSWGKKVLFAQVIIPCCSPRVMQEALDFNLSKAAAPCDAILCLSCASGVQSAFLCSRGVPVVAALDTVGPRIIGNQDGFVAQTHCRGCGKCVLTYTAG